MNTDTKMMRYRFTSISHAEICYKKGEGNHPNLKADFKQQIGRGKRERKKTMRTCSDSSYIQKVTETVKCLYGI